MTFPVKWFSSSMQGATLLSSGTAGAAHTVTQGSLIDLLKACLVTGFGSLSASSAVYDSASSTITFTTASAHAYQIDQIVESSGWNESAFNGEFRVKSVTSTTVTVGLDNGTPTVTSATGSGSVKIPGLGWVVEFEDAVTYRCIFKRVAAGATAYRLLVDNSAWTGWNNNASHLAKVSVITDVTDINTYTTIIEQRWPASHNYASSNWYLVGDGLMFYFAPAFAANGARELVYFGDINSIRPGDAHHCIFSYHEAATTETIAWSSASYYPYNNAGLINDASYRTLMRSHTQILGAVSAKLSSDHIGGIFGAGMSLPNPADNGFYFAKNIKVFDDASYRGTLPGFLAPYATSIPWDGKIMRGLNGAATTDRTLLLLLARQASGSVQAKVMLGFDIAGSWR